MKRNAEHADAPWLTGENMRAGILFAREEPTLDETVLKYVPGTTRKDTVFYRDATATNRYAIWAWHIRNRPTRRKYVTLNCFRWELVWLPPKAR